MSTPPDPDERVSVAPLLLLSVPLIALLHATTQPIATNDLHIYMAMGRWIFEHQAILDREIFTFVAPDRPFINGTWGWSMLAYGLHELGGLRALGLCNGLAVAAAVALIAQAAMRGGARPAQAALAGFYAWLLMIQNVSVRGQTLVYPLFAALLLLCASPVRLRFALFGAAALGALWAPLHGSFVAGGLAALAIALGRAIDGTAWKPAFLSALGLGIGACFGPYGPKVARYVLENTALPADRAFAEWAAPGPESFEGARFFVAIGLWLLLRGVGKGRGSSTETLLLILFGGLALTGVRFIAWFGLATAPILALRLSADLPAPGGLPRPRLRVALAGLTLLWAALLSVAYQRWTPQLTGDTPIGAAAAVHADAKRGRVLVQPEYGGYVVWQLWPDFLISSDVRAWVFDDAGWAVYAELSQAPDDWQSRLDSLSVTHMILRPGMHGDALLQEAQRSPLWRVLPSEGVAVALARVDPSAPAR